jgi:hypothetical protein
MFSMKLLLFLVGLYQIVNAFPTFEGTIMTDYSASSSSLAPGAGYITAMSPTQESRVGLKYLSALGVRGTPTNLTIRSNASPRFTEPPIFFIKNYQLYQLNNASSVFHVNVLNTTLPTDASREDHPLRIEITPQKKGIQGVWKWKQSMLFFEQGKLSNRGVFYACQDKLSGSTTSVITYLKEPSTEPENCLILTLHSYIGRERPEDQKDEL